MSSSYDINSALARWASKLTGKRILVTGGNGYIGSHTVLELLAAGAHITILDSLVNSNEICLQRLGELSGGKKFDFVKVDLRDYDATEKLAFQGRPAYDAVIHFAGLKAVGESVDQPLRYYDFNIAGAINLFKLMDKYECRRLVFSSSATVYGIVETNPIPEPSPLSTTNPYGATKLMIENILRDIAKAPSNAKLGDKAWKIAILRYFNPVGAHPSGRIGEDPNGIPNNLLPFVTQVAVGKRPHVNVFGNDYPTKDGTGVRDFIHVVDLARGHLAALSAALFGSSMATNCEAYNLGTGEGYSVMDVIHSLEKVIGRAVPFVVTPRRPGDVAACYADPTKACQQLEWKATHTLQEAVASSWKWQSANPDGFNTKQA